MRGERTPGPGSHIPAPTPALPPARPSAHSPCPGSCAPASVRAQGEPRAGRAPGVPPSPPLYPAGAASPIARPLLCAGPDSMHSSYRGGGAPAAPGARVSARGRGRAARSRGAPTAPDGRRGRGAAGAAPTPSDGRAAPLTHGHAPPPRHPPRVPPPDVSTPPPRVTFPESPEERTPRAGRGRVGGAAGPHGFALLTRAECQSLRRQPGILCPTAAAGAAPGAGTEPGDPPGALPTSARRAPGREREREERAVLRDRLLPEGTGGTERAAARQSEGKAESGRRRALLARPNGPPLCPPCVPPPLHPSLLLCGPSLRVAAWQRVARGSGSEVPGVLSATRCPTLMRTRMQTPMHTDPHRHACTRSHTPACRFRGPASSPCRDRAAHRRAGVPIRGRA